MRLKAVPRQDYLDSSALRWTFHAAKAKDTRALGAAFARAVLPRASDGNKDETLRIGLCSGSTPGLGKSIFAEGMITAIKDKRCVENPRGNTVDVRFEDRAQAVWHSPKTGWVRLYDCFCGMAHGFLMSYLKNDTSQYGFPLTDIAEHAHDDKNNKEFDFLVFFARDTGDGRNVTIATTLERARSQRLQEFFSDYARWIIKPTNDNAQTPAPHTAPAGYKIA